MKKKMTRKQELELVQRAIDLPVLATAIHEFGRWWNPSEYPELQLKVQEALKKAL